MRIDRRFTVFLLALGFLSAGWMMQTSSMANDAPKPPVKGKKKPKDLVVDGELTANDAKDSKKTDCYCKVYTFKMVKGATYQLDMKSTDLDSYLRLENPKGDQVAEDDDSGGNLDAQITYKATETGEFKVIATTFADGTTGKFNLTVKQTEAAPDEKKKDKEKGKDKDKVPAIKLKDGKGSVTAKLAEGDGKFMDKLQKTFEVTLEAGKTYQFDQASGEFDSYLYLLGPDGKVLAEDDDTGGGANGLDSRIVHKIEKAGRYRLVAASFGGTEVGEFTLSVSEEK